MEEELQQRRRQLGDIEEWAKVTPIAWFNVQYLYYMVLDGMVMVQGFCKKTVNVQYYMKTKLIL